MGSYAPEKKGKRNRTEVKTAGQDRTGQNDAG